MLAVKVDDQPGKGQTPRDPALIRSRFMKGLGTGRTAVGWKSRHRSADAPELEAVHFRGTALLGGRHVPPLHRRKHPIEFNAGF